MALETSAQRTRTIDLCPLAFGPDESYSLDPVTRCFDALFRLELTASEVGLDPREFQPGFGKSSARLPLEGRYVNGRKGEPLARRRYQEGTLELHGNSWTVRFREDMLQPDGSARRVVVRRAVGTKAEFPTRKLARRRADEIVSRINRTDYKPIRVATFAEFTDAWNGRALTLMKTSTQKAAQAHLRLYLLPEFGKVRLDEFNTGAVQGFIAMLGKKGKSRHYVKNVVSTLQSILRSARRWGYLTGEVAGLEFPSDSIRKQPHYFTAEQAAAIIDAASQPWSTIFAVAAMTGARPGEVLGLTVNNLDFEAGLIHIGQSAYYSKLQTPKTRSSINSVPMPGPLADMLREYLKGWKPNVNRLLFATRTGAPIAANNLVQRKLWPILDKLGIPRCGMHAFRHTHASLMVSLGASPAVAQRQLRHSAVTTTLGHYAHLIGDEHRRFVEKVAEQLRPNATNATKIARQPKWIQ